MQKLQSNWGDLADALECNAEVRVYDPHSSWQCYIYAQNPEYPDELKSILCGFSIEVCDICLSEIESLYNIYGEKVMIDEYFRPIKASKLLKKLLKYYEG